MVLTCDIRPHLRPESDMCDRLEEDRGKDDKLGIGGAWFCCAVIGCWREGWAKLTGDEVKILLLLWVPLHLAGEQVEFGRWSVWLGDRK